MNGESETNEEMRFPQSNIIRSMIDSENRLVNDRIGWLVTIQGLLFASLGFAWDKPNSKV